MRKWQPLAVALVTAASLLCRWESPLEAAAPAEAPVPPAQSSPALTVRQGEGSPPASPDGAGQALFTEVKDTDRISASVTNRPLDELLRIMLQKGLFEIKGPVPRGEAITTEFSNLTLEQALEELMKGYNYVLLFLETSRKPLLMVMGQATGNAYGEEGEAPPTSPPATNQPPTADGGSSTPPAPAVEQLGSGAQGNPRAAVAPPEEGGSSSSQPQAPGALPVVNEPVEDQPQHSSPPGVSSNAPNQGEGPTGQPQAQPPARGAQTRETPVPGSMNDSLPTGF